MACVLLFIRRFQDANHPQLHHDSHRPGAEPPSPQQRPETVWGCAATAQALATELLPWPQALLAQGWLQMAQELGRKARGEILHLASNILPAWASTQTPPGFNLE